MSLCMPLTRYFVASGCNDRIGILTNHFRFNLFLFLLLKANYIGEKKKNKLQLKGYFLIMASFVG